jgi:hypothetical protein
MSAGAGAFQSSATSADPAQVRYYLQLGGDIHAPNWSLPRRDPPARRRSDKETLSRSSCDCPRDP